MLDSALHILYNIVTLLCQHCSAVVPLYFEIDAIQPRKAHIVVLLSIACLDDTGYVAVDSHPRWDGSTGLFYCKSKSSKIEDPPMDLAFFKPAEYPVISSVACSKVSR
jgi:hypothetical protein